MVRTRKKLLQERKVCQECINRSIERSIPVNITKGATKALEWECMPERWFHQLVYQNVENNGLQALGMGRLWFVSESQRTPGRLGRYTDRDKNEYDMLLRGASKEAPMVCVEIKRVADENAIAQIMRYKRAIEKAGKGTPRMALVACEIPPKVMDVVEEFQAVGWPLKAFLFRLEGSQFIFSEVGGGVASGEAQAEQKKAS